MRRTKQLVASLVCVIAGVAAPSPATQPATPPDAPKMPAIARQFADTNTHPPLLQGQNAAHAYLAAWDSIATEQHAVLHARAGTNEDQPAMLAQQQAYIEKLINAATMEQCDWGLDYKSGWELVVPHLSLVRGSSRALMADASRLMALPAEGESRAANEQQAIRRIRAMLRMSEHVRNDGFIVSSLVGCSMNGQACKWIDERLQSGALSTDSAQQLLGAMRAMNTDDLFGAHASIMAEWEMFDLWFKDKFQGEHAAKELAAFIPVPTGDVPQPIDHAIREMNQTQLDAAVARFKDFYTDSAAAWSQPNGHDELQRLAAAAVNGEYGLLTQRMAPVFGKPWTTDSVSRKTFENTKTLLATYLQHGGTLPEELRTPPTPPSH
jgi:hypothetical protein